MVTRRPQLEPRTGAAGQNAHAQHDLARQRLETNGGGRAARLHPALADGCQHRLDDGEGMSCSVRNARYVGCVSLVFHPPEMAAGQGLRHRLNRSEWCSDLVRETVEHDAPAASDTLAHFTVTHLEAAVPIAFVGFGHPGFSNGWA